MQTMHNVTINADKYSLNSVNGFCSSESGETYFYKFHQEDGEDEGVDEYYNAKALEKAGYPVEQPLFASSIPGKQVLVYRKITDPRFSDVCSDIEKGSAEYDQQEILLAQCRADRHFSEIAQLTLRHSDDPAGKNQAIYQLFYNRLVDAKSSEPTNVLGGRVAQFYLQKPVCWPGILESFENLWDFTWCINGEMYPTTLRHCFQSCMEYLVPSKLLPGPVVTAHGDAHNANVWYRQDSKASGTLSLFDPAFASDSIPALLAEIKATFHNIFAHPFWLYEPGICQKQFNATASIKQGVIHVETDYDLSPLRESFLCSKAENYWAPLIARMAKDEVLHHDWEKIIRLGMFSCPTLVMQLTTGEHSTHNPTSSLIGFCQAIRAATLSKHGQVDMFTRFFDRVSDQTTRI